MYASRVKSSIAFCLLFGIAANASDMYWADLEGSAIYRTNLETEETIPLITSGVVDPYRITIDQTEGKIYWTQTNEFQAVKRANLDGSGVETVVYSSFGTIIGIAADPANRRVFYSTGSEIRQVDTQTLATSFVVDLEPETTPPVLIQDIALDAAHDRVYGVMWDGTVNERSLIRWASLEDYSVHTALELGFGGASGLDIDPRTDRMYWTRIARPGGPGGQIRRANLDGSENEPVFSGTPRIPDTLAIDPAGDRVFWSIWDFDTGNRQIQSSRLDGTDVHSMYTGAAMPAGLVIIPEPASILLILVPMLILSARRR